MSPDANGLVPHHGAPDCAANSWGPYYDTLHPVRTVHWKAAPNWRNDAAALWRQREELRREYAAVHGSDPALWPSRHPGVILGAKAACLRCHWLHVGGRYLDGGG